MSATDHVHCPQEILGLFTELLGIGGVQEAGRMTAAALFEMGRASGRPVDILSLNDPRGEQCIRWGDSEIAFSGLGRAKARFVLSAIGKACRRPREGTPIILAAHPHLALPASWIQRVRPNFKVVVMSHGIEVWKPLASRRLRAFQQAILLTAPSSYTARKMAEEQGVPESKIRRLPWPLSPDFIKLAEHPGKLPLPRGFPRGRIILTVGRWAARERYKGVDALIVAVARVRTTIPDVQLVAVGSGDDLSRLRSIAAEEQVADRVHFLEGLSKEELASCYAAADVFALPSIGEGFGLVFLEAMAFGKPVVGADAGGITDLIRDGSNGLLIPPNDPDGLAQGLSRLLQDEALRRKLGECGAAMVRREYQFDAFREALDQILGDVACGRL
jgi:glycosyltransferase involved in cell wall biosynthesis